VLLTDGSSCGAVPISTEVLGAGDIVAIDPSMIGRVEPPTGAIGVEPNYMPFVEFVDADFPWRYSLEPGGLNRAMPWLTLIALMKHEFEIVAQGAAPLPRIRILDYRKSLPPIENSWATAHVHLATGAAPGVALAALVNTRPELSVGRTTCHRRLEDSTLYHLFLVPTYEAGRRAGLGISDAPPIWKGLAWPRSKGETPPPTPEVVLPIFYQSQFVTSVLEDFESLIGRLRSHKATGTTGVGSATKAYAGQPGYYAGGWKDFPVQDALVQPDAQSEPFVAEANTDLLAATLNEVIAGEQLGADDETAEDPLVAMPGYGLWFQGDRVLSAAKAAQGDWFHRLNLDLRYRQAAGLGAETVRRNQERFMGACWEQYSTIIEANQQIAQLQAASMMAAILNINHFSNLGADVALNLAEPVHDLVRLDPARSVGDVLASADARLFASRGVLRAASRRSRSAGAAPGAIESARGRIAASLAIPGDTAARDDNGRIMSVSAARSTGASASASRSADAGGAASSGVDSAILAGAVADFLVEIPKRKLTFEMVGLTLNEIELFEPVFRSPEIEEPLVRALVEFSSESLLRSASELPANSVTLVKENGAFVEAFMVGANHAMNAELLFRGFPCPPYGTIFRQFWDRSDHRKDIHPIRDWNSGPLGSHAPGVAAGGAEKLFLAIRSDAQSRMGKLFITLDKCSTKTWSEGVVVTSHQPLFSGMIGRDIAFYAFPDDRDDVTGADKAKYSFVIHEPPGRLRFGLDIATVAVRRGAFPVDHAKYSFQVSSLPNRQPEYDRAAAQADALSGAGGPARSSSMTWENISWSHVPLDKSSRYIDFSGNLSVTMPSPPDYWHATDRTSASLAMSFLQKPVAAVLPASRVL
jgi:hypothetical protein